MADSDIQQLENQGLNKKAKTQKLEEDDEGGGGNMSDCGGDVELEVVDPMAVFGQGVMLIIFGKLEPLDVVQSCLVSREWNAVASTDSIWESKLEELWQGKAHIPRMAKAPGISKLTAYSLSILDSRRMRITGTDLCDHTWDFHYTQEAPEYWRNLDPYWTGSGNPMRRYFHSDGSITADSEDKVWGGHESSYTTVTGVFEEDGSIRQHYVRINRWPQMAVRRKTDWSWELSNILYCYTSLPDSSDKEDGTGPYSLF